MNSEDYIKQLQQCATEEGLVRLRTLLLEFAAPLARLPGLKAELEAMMVEQAGIDYDHLADKLERQLERADVLLAKIETLPAEVRTKPEMQELLNGIVSTMTLRTISVWEGELEICKKAVEQRRIAEQQAAEEQILKQREAEVERQRLLEKERQREQQKKEQMAHLERWLDLVAIPGGVFDRTGGHRVELDSFSLGKYPVTQGLWQAVMGENPSYIKLGESFPVEGVSWNDVQVFLGKLNQMTGKEYRLPTEAEWEYAARSGGKKELWAGTSDKNELQHYAWYDGNSGGVTHPVGEKLPNGFGLYDMSGNVTEWCQDWYGFDYYEKSIVRNPPGPSLGNSRVNRGGCYRDNPHNLHSASRNSLSPSFAGDGHGLRLSLPGQ